MVYLRKRVAFAGEIKLTEFVSIFNNGREVTAAFAVELFNHVRKSYLEDKENFMSIISDLGVESAKELSQDTHPYNSEHSLCELLGSVILNLRNYYKSVNQNQPLGSLGNKTFNEAMLEKKKNSAATASW